MKAQFEKISKSKSVLNAFIYEDFNFNAPWHFHPEFELTYILKGKGMRYVGNSIQKFEEGDFVLLGENLPHCWKNTDAEKDGVKSLVFQWDTTILGKNWLEKDTFYHIKKLFERTSKGVLFKDAYAMQKKDILIQIINKKGVDQLLSFIYVLEDLAHSNEFELLTHSGFSTNLNLKANHRIEKVQEYISLNYNKKIKLDDVANLTSMSNEAFCRFFKKYLNKSFFTFVNEYKINLASKLLIETNKQVSQIAYECGYESLPFFYRQFQKFMNCSPKTFKNSYKSIS